jgi:hypothetical protein
MQKRGKKFCYVGASTACRLVAFSATFGCCLLRILSLCVPLSGKIIPMTDMVLCYGSADGVALRAQVLYRKKFPAIRGLHPQTFLVVVYGKMALFDREVWTGRD